MKGALTRRERELLEHHACISCEIASRLDDFKSIWEHGADEKIFMELAFCLFTPQSKAQSCWHAVTILYEKNLLFSCSQEDAVNDLNIVRFKNNKAGYLVAAQKMFMASSSDSLRTRLKGFSSPLDARDWLVATVKGLGYKEASHFLRNIGYSFELAILDRHILKNLHYYDVVRKIPATLTRKRYLQIEQKMRSFAGHLALPLSHLDFVLWYKEAGHIFK